MNQSYVLKKAILSEKAYVLMKRGTYTFLVDARAHKEEIAKAVGLQFGVSVAKVRISKFAPKTKRIIKSRKTTVTGGGKKALITLASGQSIALLAPKSEKGKKKIKKEENKNKEK